MTEAHFERILSAFSAHFERVSVGLNQLSFVAIGARKKDGRGRGGWERGGETEGWMRKGWTTGKREWRGQGRWRDQEVKG